MNYISDEIIHGLFSVIEKTSESISLHEPLFDQENEWAYVKECIDTGWVSTAGSFVEQFSEQLAIKCGVKYVIATNSGTSALHAALLISGVEAGDEVLLPAFTFVATANAVRYVGGCPHFVDIDDYSLGIDMPALKQHLENISIRKKNHIYNKITGKKISAIIPVHTFGHPVDMEPLMELGDEYNIHIIEDSAAGLGSTYKNKPVGSIGDIGCISFNGNKIITTGCGGAILTNDPDMAERAKHLTSTAKKKHKWAFEHDAVGFNYRMSNINAALGCAQLQSLDSHVKFKRDLAKRYIKAFSTSKNVKVFKEASYANSNYWLNTLILNIEDISVRDKVLDELNDNGILCRPAWKLMSKLEMYKTCPSMPLPVSERLEQQVINIPSGPGLTLIS